METPSSPALFVNPTQLRGILNYVPLFQDRTFVIALDGRIVDDDNLTTLLLDVAVLQSLSIRVVLVFGIGHQLEKRSREQGLHLSDQRGTGPTDQTTLNLAREVAADLGFMLLGKMGQAGLRAALTNAIRPIPTGIVGGVDQLFTGRVDRVETGVLQNLIDQRIVPILTPVCFDREGQAWRLNSDHLATAAAVALRATKILYLQPEPGLVTEETFFRHLSMEEIDQVLEKYGKTIAPTLVSKVQQAKIALSAGIPRVHLIDGTLQEALLSEIFSTEGVGTLLYGNEYQHIRPATRKDIRTLYNLTRLAVRREELVHRTLAQLEKSFAQYYLFEIDESPVACAALAVEPDGQTAELRSLFVQPAYQHMGIGRKLVEFIIREARDRGTRKLFALSTQSYAFFRNVCHFEEASPDDLPPSRRTQWEKNQRNSRVLVKILRHD